MAKHINVGVIGVGADHGWARKAHLPAVQAVDGLTLMAVATTSQQPANAVASALGVSRAYANASDLIADSDVDIVTVAAAVPARRDLILAALHAGKHVMTEWPVGTTTAQTEEIAPHAEPQTQLLAGQGHRPERKRQWTCR